MIECYAVFEGGGAKGAAFAGALKAAENSNIRFVGYGGASAGAIIAFMSSLGMSAEDILNSMKARKFVSLLDENSLKNTNRLKNIISSLNKINKNISRCNIMLRRAKSHRLKAFLLCKKFNYVDKKVYFYTSSIKMVYLTIKICLSLIKNKGLHNKINVRGFLVDCAKNKLKSDAIKNDRGVDSITFSDFYEFNHVDLRIIATDVLTGRAIEFSSEKTPGQCIFDAIVASCSYPLFFQPSTIEDLVLVDGGISCNLPTFLFNRPKFKNLPVYAFDLISEGVVKRDFTKYGFLEYIKDFINSAVDASNNIISDVVGGISVPVIVPKKYTTLNFTMEDEDIDLLYKSGLKSATEFFENHHLTKGLSKANSIFNIAKSLCGDFDYFLSMIRNQLKSGIFNGDLKIWLYVSIDSKDSEIVTVSNSCAAGKIIKDHRYILSSDNQHIDCVRSWSNAEFLISYNPKKKTTRFCFPVMKINKLDSNCNDLIKKYGNQVIALLCVDASVYYQNCSLLSRESYVINGIGAFEVDSRFSTALSAYSLTIRNVLIGQRSLFHESKSL